MFRIYTDTSSNLPAVLIEKHGIETVPFHYTVNGREFAASMAFDGKAFYDAMRNGASVQTSMISIGAFCEAFEKSLAAGEDILFIGMSGGISGTYNSSVLAADEMREKYPARRIVTVDTRGASLGEGLAVLYAAGLKEAGASLEEVAEAAAVKSAYVCHYLTVEDLIYLKRGGRISGTSALVGNILHIKPVLRGSEEGQIVLYRKERGRKKALDALAAKYQELVADMNAPVGISHADCAGDAELLARMLREKGCRGEILTELFEPVTGTHVGPGAVAVFFCGIHK